MELQLSSHSSWVAASGDFSLAFLNSDMPSSELILAEPLTALRRLRLVPPGKVWRARTHIYGLRRSPKAWGQLRDSTLNGKTLEASTGKLEVKLVPEEEGLFLF